MTTSIQISCATNRELVKMYYNKRYTSYMKQLVLSEYIKRAERRDKYIINVYMSGASPRGSVPIGTMGYNRLLEAITVWEVLCLLGWNAYIRRPGVNPGKEHVMSLASVDTEVIATQALRILELELALLRCRKIARAEQHICDTLQPEDGEVEDRAAAWDAVESLTNAALDVST